MLAIEQAASLVIIGHLESSHDVVKLGHGAAPLLRIQTGADREQLAPALGLD